MKKPCLSKMIRCRHWIRHHAILLVLIAAALVRATGDTFAFDHRSTWIEWDPSTLVLVQKGAFYGRMLRLADNGILCAFSANGGISVCTSRDDGQTWSEPQRCASYGDGVVTNPEILRLSNGRILLSYNQRPRDGRHSFAIAVCFSDDGGTTWTSHRRVYEAGTQFGNGCWEPAQIQLATGEIQLFFANESPYRASNEQEITLLRSFDQGNRWGPPETVSFRSGGRDGMPVPLLLNDGRGVVVAIEDNGFGGVFKPAIIWTSVADNWKPPPASGDSPRRWPALAVPLPHQVYAGAPYVRQLVTGETLLSVQSTEGRPRATGPKRAYMAVYVGDKMARHFVNRSVPFQVFSSTNGLWNSLFVKNASIITAISTTTIRDVHGLWSIDGRIVRLGTTHQVD